MPVCPIKSENYCMAWLLSQQDDFKNQPSMLETFKLIQGAGHEYIFLPKFQYELNPIKMVYKLLCRRSISNNNLFSDPLCMHNRYGPCTVSNPVKKLYSIFMLTLFDHNVTCLEVTEWEFPSQAT